MPHSLYLLLSFAISFAVVFFAVPKIILVSNEKKLFDVPTHRSANQKHIIPNLGGIAIFSGIFISVLITLTGFDINKIDCLLLSSLIMFLMGLKDDTIGLSAKKKLIGQVFVAIFLVTVCQVRFTSLHGILGIYEINYASSLVISVITMIGIINAFNLIDGIDGLSTGIGTVISSVYGILFLYFGQLEYAILSFSITGSLVAFFFFNVFGTKNKIFMGDTGSLTLGVMFAILTIWYNEIIPANNSNNLIWTSPAISLAIMIVPVIDTIRVFTVRISQKRSPFAPDMNHIHHQLIKINKNHLHASIILILGNLIFIAMAFGFIDILGNNILFFSLLILGFSVASIPATINLKMKPEEEMIKVTGNLEESHLHLIKTIRFHDIPEQEETEKEKNAVVSKNDHFPKVKIHSN
ncbi:MAG: MraY family glycosyltransferase [Bacteroidota bacterium]|nr:MraY family glycosyltransferase [Bacteroidota bacterium]